MGRPRQPNCPDCLKNGVEVPKASGYGYCKPHAASRQRSYVTPTSKESESAELTPEQRRLQDEYKELLSLREENKTLRAQVTSLARQVAEREEYIGQLARRNTELLMRD